MSQNFGRELALGYTVPFTLPYLHLLLNTDFSTLTSLRFLLYTHFSTLITSAHLFLYTHFSTFTSLHFLIYTYFSTRPSLPSLIHIHFSRLISLHLLLYTYFLAFTSLHSLFNSSTFWLSVVFIVSNPTLSNGVGVIIYVDEVLSKISHPLESTVHLLL